MEEKLIIATTDKQRIKVVEQFLVSQLKDIQTDKIIVEAVKLIYQSNGTIRIKELNEKLFISQSPFEKRFRKVVGTTAKKFASIVRFNSVLDNLSNTKSLTEICYENNFFDQAHFIKDFKQFTGDTPENFQTLLVEKRFFTITGTLAVAPLHSNLNVKTIKNAILKLTIILAGLSIMVSCNSNRLTIKTKKKCLQ